MKTTKMLSFAALGLFAGTFLTACSEQKQAENAQEEVTEAQEDLEDAKANAAEEWAEFKMESEERMRANEERIAEYREQIKADKNKAEREAKIAEMERQNEALRARINEYENSDDKGNERWESFKREFNHDMDALGESIGDIFENNEK